MICCRADLNFNDTWWHYIQGSFKVSHMAKSNRYSSSKKDDLLAVYLKDSTLIRRIIEVVFTVENDERFG